MKTARGLATLLLCSCSGLALAQVSVVASVVSDYRVRGVSLSDSGAAEQLSIAYDHPQGWYAGLFASSATLRTAGDTEELMGYAGFARLLAPGLSWEAGISKSAFRSAALYDYVETFIGLAGENLGGRLSYAPDYFGRGSHTMYGELNGNLPLAEHLRLTGHLGLQHAHPVSWLATPTPSWRADMRIGLALDAGAWKLQAAWLATQKKHPLYLYDDGGAPRQFTVGAAYEF
jgi:uncharacterized protein (TIGR02001 family)